MPSSHGWNRDFFIRSVCEYTEKLRVASRKQHNSSVGNNLLDFYILLNSPLIQSSFVNEDADCLPFSIIQRCAWLEFLSLFQVLICFDLDYLKLFVTLLWARRNNVEHHMEMATNSEHGIPRSERPCLPLSSTTCRLSWTVFKIVVIPIASTNGNQNHGATWFCSAEKQACQWSVGFLVVKTKIQKSSFQKCFKNVVSKILMALF